MFCIYGISNLFTGFCINQPGVCIYIITSYTGTCINQPVYFYISHNFLYSNLYKSARFFIYASKSSNPVSTYLENCTGKSNGPLMTVCTTTDTVMNTYIQPGKEAAFTPKLTFCIFFKTITLMRTKKATPIDVHTT